MPEYIQPLVTVDSVLFTVVEDNLKVLLVQRSIEPFIDSWSLPGGFVDPAIDSTTEDTASRKLAAKAGIHPNYLEQLQTFSGANRDPRGFAITVAYFALIAHQQTSTHVETVHDAEWIDYDDIEHLDMAFDHKLIIKTAYERLQQKALYSMLPVFCLPELFTISQLKQVIEAIIGKEVQRKSLIRRIEKSEMFTETDSKVATGKRQAQLYTLKPDANIFHFERNMSL
ncbi:NUDIX domain-containing protein [Paraferrimonas sp. SM1919]|uniref:NUDIX hydrolase n=1 Tax=Paraferrimonas sp. SM1919 TaxID=2662263 RepID=UPI0013D7B544|nr:NUDIX domain-containing protein [Paraferrimonas sp. SM1919]